MTAEPGPAKSDGDERRATFGPFHRLESPTQTTELATRQEKSGELRGKTPRNSAWPHVQGYRGPLPPGARGIEFYTDAAPEGSGSNVAWSARGNRTGVWLEGEYAKITVVIVKNTQRAESQE